MKRYLLSLIFLASIGTFYGQDLTISYEILSGSPTATVLIKMQNNTVSDLNIGAVGLSMVYRTTGMSGDIATYQSVSDDVFDGEWPGSAFRLAVATEPLGSILTYDGIDYNGRWQYGNTDDNFLAPTFYTLAPGVKTTVMEVVFNVGGLVNFRMENESENILSQIADELIQPITYDIIAENNPFPVEWLSFDAEQMSNSQIQLDWETGNETNNSHFEIERSTDNLLFSTVGKVDGAGTIDYTQKYEFMDNVVKAKTYYYRLKQVDLNGQFEYSETRQVEITEMNQFGLQVYPNPANDWINVEAQIAGNETYMLQISDMNGRILYKKDLSGQPDFKLDVDLSKFVSGVYNIVISDVYGQSASSARFIKK